MRKLYDPDGKVKGYELNGVYLMKHYYFVDSYDWIINRTGINYNTSHEFNKAYDNGEIILVSNFKEGKNKLMEMAGE